MEVLKIILVTPVIPVILIVSHVQIQHKMIALVVMVLNIYKFQVVKIHVIMDIMLNLQLKLAYYVILAVLYVLLMDLINVHNVMSIII